MAEINAPRASRLRNLDVRHPEIHTDARTVCDEWKSTSSVLLLVPEVSASLKKEDSGCMSALASHCSSPLSPSSFGPSANAAFPIEIHVWT